MIKLLNLFFLPPLVIARLGASATPLECFRWQEDPASFGGAKTAIEPEITIDIRADGSIQPYLPSVIRFKDDGLIRPLAPFIELWATVSEKGAKVEVPVTEALLERLGLGLGAVRYSIEAANLKAARRTDDLSCGFVARAAWTADDFGQHELLASSPQVAGSIPLVLPQAPISLGTVRSIKPGEGEAMGIDLARLRIRFTPAAGNVYGPPTPNQSSDEDLGRPGSPYPIVPQENRFLNQLSAWSSYRDDSDLFNHPSPADTYDGADQEQNISFGVVDDTCDAVMRATISSHEDLEAAARLSCAPPDFAPDRRPFVSLGDELAAREGPPPTDHSDDDRRLTKEEIADLFERAYETLSLLNLDAVRRVGLADNQQNNRPPAQMRGTPLTNDGSMTPKDKRLFDESTGVTLAKPTQGDPLPYSTFAEQIHSDIRDLDSIIDYLAANPDRVRALVRPPYGPFSKLAARAPTRPAPDHRDPRDLRDYQKDMRMPPYMRDSDAGALSLTRRQYKHLMDFLDAVEAGNVERPVDEHVQRGARRQVAKPQVAKWQAAKPQDAKPQAAKRRVTTRRGAK